MKKNKTKISVYYLIWKVGKYFPKTMWTMVITACILALDTSLRPYLLKVLLNNLVDTHKNDLIFSISYPIFFYVGASFIFTTIYRFNEYLTEVKMYPALRKKIISMGFADLLGRSYLYHKENFSGSLSKKIHDIAEYIPDIIQVIFDRLLTHVLTLIVATIFLWQVSYVFSFIMIFWCSAFMLVNFFLGRRLTHLSDKWVCSISKLNRTINDIFANILSVRLFCREKKEVKFINTQIAHVLKDDRKVAWSSFWLWSFYGYSFLLVLVFNFYFLIYGRQNGWVTVGDFALVITIMLSTLDLLWKITKDFSCFSKLMGKTSYSLKFFTFFSKEEEKKPKLQVHEGKIEFRNVFFNYAGKDYLFADKSLSIFPKETIGLVGYSGSGKSTFSKLLLGILKAKKGSIFIDGQDIQKVSIDSLHRSIGSISQEPLLFHRSLYENIVYGTENSSYREVLEASKKACAHDFIKDLPKGYDSVVGERGFFLSGGERQLIILARLILNPPPIIILDEATSEIDVITEKRIQSAIEDLIKNRTAIIIAHRIYTLKNVDRIFVFEKGKIVEEGNHNSLIKKGVLYREFWNAQNLLE